MKFAFCLGLLAVAFASQQWETSPRSEHISEKAFRAGKHYTFHFDGQISTGLPLPSSQHAATRVQSVVSLVFSTDRSALLKIQKIRVGAAHRDLVEPRNLQPFGLFEEQPLTEEQTEKLRLPLRFRYEQGLVSEMEFDSQEQPWSANIKRAIVNMLQVNLQKKARTDEAEISRILRDNNEQLEKESDFFTTQETTLEGDCEAAYTVVPTKEGEDKLRVSKSINFDKCAKRVDIRYNFRFGEECPSCEKKFNGEEQNTESATVLKFEINGTPEEFLIREVELRSQYLFSPLNKEQNLMGTFVANKLTLVKVDSDKERVEEPKKSEKKETLVYSTEWEEKLEKFRMTGEESLLKESPYTWMTKKVEIARQIIKELVREIFDEEKNNGFQLESNHQVARLVEVLRVCTKEDIKKIAVKITESEKSQVKDLFYDILAIAGTKNTIEYLNEKIVAREMTPLRASRVVKMLMNVRNPSEQIIDQLVSLCKEDISERNPMLKQSCWLTTGALLNGLCGEQRDRLALEVSTERKHNVCPRQTKQKYVHMFEKMFERASTRYEKVLALKAMANSGMDLIVFPLEKIITDRRQEKTIRLQSIDALRQLRSVMPRKVQSILMPLYKDQREQPEIRVAAFHQIMHTLPERAILDQITQQLEKEPSHQVHAFVYSALKSYAKSEIPCEQDMSKDIEQSLRLARVQPRKVLDSHFLRASLYHDEYYTGAALNWAALFSNDSVLPKEITASLDTVFGGQWNKYLAQIGFAQHNVDQVLYKLLEKFEQSEIEEVMVRGKRSTTVKPAEALRKLMEKMNIKHRRQSEKNAHAMVYARYQDLDYALLPIDEETFPALLKNVVREGKIDLSEIEKFLAKGYRFSTDVASFLYERTRVIPTTLGMPVEITGKMPTIASVEGEIKAELEPKTGKSFEGLRLRLIAKPKVASTHVSHMEIRSPIVSQGVKLLHSAQLNLPVDVAVEMNWEKNFDIKTTIKAPEHNKRVVILHSRPVTYLRHENNEIKMESAIEKTVFLPEQPRQPIQRVYGEELLGLRFQARGNVHRHLFEGRRSALPVLVCENHVEIVMEKGEDMPREYVIRMNIAAFDQETRMSEKPEFESFFDKNNEEIFEVEDSEYVNEDEKERRTSFKTYAKNYKTEKSAYKHRMHLRVEAIGSSVARKGEMEIRSVCDDQLTFCKWTVDATRTPLFQGERRQWELKASVQTLFPEPVMTMEQLREQKHREMQTTVEAKWGSEEKNTVTLKIQAEQNKEQKNWQKIVVRKVEDKKSPLEQYEQVALAARLNQVKIVADYELSPKTLLVASRIQSLLKSYQPWFAQVDILSPATQYNKAGRLIAKLSVEPQTWRYANLSIETPAERVAMHNIYLPIRPTFLSIEQSQPVRGWAQVGRQLTSRATCEVSSNKVSTFDDVIYRTPITTCYAVLAKDCSDEQPKFAVLMKNVEKKSEEKKIKIITEENVIEIENKKEKLVVKVDGKTLTKEQEFEKFGLEKRAEDVIIFENEDIYVRFDGYKAEIRMSELYKNQQCGICGHYDGEREGEFRTSGNEETEDMELFHRSFLARDEECEMEEDKLTKKDNYKRFEQSEESSSSEETDFDQYNKKTERKNKRVFDNEDDTVEPEEETKVMEYSQRICFSKNPVPVCPRKSHEIESETKEMKVKFACLRRSEPEARRLLREARREVISIEHLPESFVETLRVPKACTVY